MTFSLIQMNKSSRRQLLDFTLIVCDPSFYANNSRKYFPYNGSAKMTLPEHSLIRSTTKIFGINLWVIWICYISSCGKNLVTNPLAWLSSITKKPLQGSVSSNFMMVKFSFGNVSAICLEITFFCWLFAKVISVIVVLNYRFV